MNMYDRINSPLANLENVKRLIAIYARLKDAGKLNKMYNYIVNENKEMSHEESALYNKNFFTYIVEPFVIEMGENLKRGTYDRYDNTFMHLYTVEDMQAIFQEKSAQELIERGRKIESRDPNVYDQLNSIFWKNSNTERKDLYKKFLIANNIQLTEAELLDWMDYRAVIEEFQNPLFMGFHCGEPLKETEKMKLYINAGANTYELANIFYNECKKQGINTKFKVSIANMASELKRNDRLCIYIDDLTKLAPYIHILENIRAERTDFDFQSPMLTAGNIDNWIGIGSDINEKSSFNKDMCDVLINSCNKYFSGKNFNEISAQIQQNPQLLKEVIETASEECLAQGRSDTKLCILKADETALQSIEIHRTKATVRQGDETTNYKEKCNPNALENVISSINPNDVDIETLKFLYENHYNGKIENPTVRLAFQLYCETRAKDEKIEDLNAKVRNRDELIKYDEDVINQLTDRINRLHEMTMKTKQTFVELGAKIYDLGKNVYELGTRLEKEEGKSIFKIISQRIKSAFSKTPLLPAASVCKNMYEECKFIDNGVTNARFSMQNYDEKENIRKMNNMLRERQAMRKGVDTSRSFSNMHDREQIVFNTELQGLEQGE